MRHFKDGDTIFIEPWRARAFPVTKDLIVDRSAFDRIIQSGGFVSVNTGQAPEANSIPVPRENAEDAISAPEMASAQAEGSEVSARVESRNSRNSRKVIVRAVDSNPFDLHRRWVFDESAGRQAAATQSPSPLSAADREA